MLYIWMPEGLNTWFWTDGQSDWHAEPSFERLVTAIKSNYTHPKIVVFVPIALHQTLLVDLNKAQARQLGEQGIKYLVEEYTLISIDELNIKTWFKADEKTSLLLSAQSVIKTYMSLLNSPFWSLQAIIPDAFLLPNVPQTDASVYKKPSVSTVNTPTNNTNYEYICATNQRTGFSVSNWAMILPRIDAITNLAVFSELDAVSLESLAHAKVQLVPESTKNLFDSMSKTNWLQHPFNLLPKTKNDVDYSIWFKVLGVLLAVIIAFVIQQLFAGYQYTKAATILEQQNLQQYRQWFPQEREIKDLKRQLQGHLGSTGQAGDKDIFVLLTKVLTAMQQSQIYATQINYAHGRVSLVIKAPNISALDSFKQQLETQGLKVSVNVTKSPTGSMTGTVEINE